MPDDFELDYKTIKHIHESGDLHEFTFSCFERRQLLTNELWLREFCRRIDRAGELAQVGLHAFVLMPEHVHLLVGGFRCAEEIAPYLFALKQPFSKKIKSLLKRQRSSLLDELTIQERPGKMVFRFWQEGPGYDRNLRTREAVLASIDYFHANPVKRKLCERAIDWKWSSARRFYFPMEPLDPDLPMIHPFPRDYVE